MNLSMIVALADDRVIGHNNQLIWHMPADLKHFRRLTMGHTLIMGRKTYESIGKPLKGRSTIVVSRQQGYDAKGCEVAGSLHEAIGMAEPGRDVFIAGGGQIYEQAMHMKEVSTIYLTRIYGRFTGDTFFPEIDEAEWICTSKSDHEPDEANRYPYSFMVYQRKAFAG